MNNATQTNNNTALYIAGDSNIFFPALVALTSIEKHNPGRFDRFMCFDIAHLTSEMEDLLQFYGIQFVDTSSLSVFEEIHDMDKMSGWWPLEIYLNWAMPEYFSQLGYRYSIKSDYDILCIAPYEQEFDHYLAANQPFVGVTTKGVTTEEINPEIVEKIRAHLSLSCEHEKAINVGFLFCDNHVCQQIGLFDRFKELHSIIASQEPRMFVDEQIAAAILMHQTPTEKAKYLNERYNMRVRRSPTTEDDFRADIANIHYITEFKPWKPITAANARSCGKTFHPIIPMYRNLWIRHAKTLKKSELFLNEVPLDEYQLIGVVSNGTKGLKNSLNKIKRDLTSSKNDLVKTKEDLSKTKVELTRVSKELEKTKHELSEARQSWIGSIKAKLNKFA